MAVDPVCGMRVEPETAARAERQGVTYYFCSTRCHQKFIADPGHYIHDEKPVAATDDRGVTYTCPMHPEVRQQGPGACPQCGMTLERRTVTLKRQP